MLTEAGFKPISSFIGLLSNLLLLTGILVLPLVALAAVTRNFARMTLAVLGAIVCLIVIVFLTSNGSTDRVAIPYGTEIAFFLALCLGASVVILQYARRSAKVSWVLLALLVVLSGAFTMGGSPDNTQMDRNYRPDQRTSAAAQFAYQEGTGPSAFVTQKRDRVGISIPILVSGISDGTVTIPDFLKVTLQIPGGDRWTSVWQPSPMDKFFPGERSANAQFTMPRRVYDDFKGKSLNVQIVFALTQAQAGNIVRFNLGQDDFTVSGVGVCTPVTGFSERPDEIGGIACRAPLRQPELTLVSSSWSNGPCNGKSPNLGESVQTAAWIGWFQTERAEFSIVPVWTSPITLSNQIVTESNRPVKVRHLCPGTPVSFTKYTLMARSQTTLWINSFGLPPLDAGQITVINQD